jgi:1-phosphatidylinositol phosphodiesterase
LLFGVLAGSSQVHAGFNNRDWTNSRGNSRNWMAGLRDDVRMSQLSIPGTHNSGADHGIPQVRTQSTSIARQLNNGHRLLDIRVRETNGVFAIHHGAVYLGQMYGDVLNTVGNFLRANPNEVVYMRLKQEHSAVSDAVFNRVLNERYLNDPRWRDFFYYANGNNNPTLGQTRGKIVILRNFLGNSVGIPYPAAFNIQDNWNVSRFGVKRQAIHGQMINSRNSLGENGITYINFTSAAHVLTPPISFARELNGVVLNHMIQRYRGHMGMVVTDFANEAFVNSIIDLNQRLRVGANMNALFNGYRVSIQSVMDPWQVVDWRQQSSNNNAAMFRNLGRRNQKWYLDHIAGTNRYRITSDADGNRRLAVTGNNVVVSNLTNESAQWEIVRNGWHTNGTVVFLRNVANGNVLDIEESVLPYGNLITHPQKNTNNNNQRFILHIEGRR